MIKYAEIGDIVYFWFASNLNTGNAGDGATPTYVVRLAGAVAGAAKVSSGTPTLLSHADYSDGSYEIAIPTTGWSAGEYAVFCSLTISSVNPNGFVGSFKLRAAGTGAIKVDLVSVNASLQTATLDTIKTDMDNNSTKLEAIKAKTDLLYSGSGVPHPFQVKDNFENVVSGAVVTVCTDSQGLNVVATGQTDETGFVSPVFVLQPGTYYFFVTADGELPGVTQETVA